MSKRRVGAIITVIIAVAVVGSLAYLASMQAKSRARYSVVLMSNGDIYVGQLSRFPRLELRNGYQVSKGQSADSTKPSPFQLLPFKEALWGPDVLYLNSRQVLLVAPVGEGSQIMNTLKSVKAL